MFKNGYQPPHEDIDFAYAASPEPAIRWRIVVERAILRHAIRSLIDAGYALRLHDGEDYATQLTTDLPTLMDEAQAADEEQIRVYEDNALIAVIYLVYGNDGFDVIGDYSLKLEQILNATSEFAESFE